MSTADILIPFRNGLRGAVRPSGLIERMRTRMAERRRAQRDVALLLRLDDRGLRDIGVTRGEILRRRVA